MGVFRNRTTKSAGRHTIGVKVIGCGKAGKKVLDIGMSVKECRLGPRQF